MGGIVMGISSFVYNYTHINTIIIAFMTNKNKTQITKSLE